MYEDLVESACSLERGDSGGYIHNDVFTGTLPVGPVTGEDGLQTTWALETEED